MSNPHIYDRAFPVSFENSDGSVTTTLGLTKREYFAGLALQGMLASQGNGGEYYKHNEIVKEAVWYTDALIAELAKTEGGAA